MTEPRRIHPEHDPEAPPVPTAPLMPHGASRSDQSDPTNPPFAIPITQEKPHKKKRSCCCKCLCWTTLVLVVIILILGILAATVYFVYDPKIPKYSIDSLQVTQFDLNTNMSLYATFNVNITLENPNTKIGIYYENGSDIKALYNETQVCEGTLPKFYQGHKNTTVLQVPLTGQTENATELLQSLRIQQQSGSIPLKLKAKVPVRIKLGSIKLPKWKFSVKCNLLVNDLSANKDISLTSSDCKIKFDL